MKRLGDGRFYLVREDSLTESMLKTIEVKRILTNGEEKTIQEAVKRSDSRAVLFINTAIQCFRSNPLHVSAS